MSHAMFQSDNQTLLNVSALIADLRPHTDADCTAIVLRNLPSVDPVVAATRFAIQSIFSPIVFVFGLLTNVINIVILTRKEMRSSTNVYLTSVAVCDVGYLLFAYLNGLKNSVLTLNVSAVYMFAHAYMGPFCSLFSNVSVWIICTFTVERFTVVRWPMKGITWCTIENAKLAIVVVVCLASLLTVNEFFVLPQTGSINGTNCTIWRRPSPIGALDAFKNDIHYNWIMPILFQFIPFILLLVLNGFLIKSVIKAQKERVKMMANSSTSESCKLSTSGNNQCSRSRNNDSQRRRRSVNDGASKSESKTTVLLIAVVLLFLICHLPSAFVLLHNDYQNRRYHGLLPKEQVVRRLVIGNASNALVQLNSATNFILYSFLSRKFVTVFKRLLRKALPCMFKKADGRADGADTQDSRVMAFSSNSGRQSIVRPRVSAHGHEKPVSEQPSVNSSKNCNNDQLVTSSSFCRNGHE